MDNIDTSKQYGVYKLLFTNAEREQMYIGSTVRSFNKRWGVHLRDLRGNRHRNKRVQRLYDKYGKPEFSILEVCENKETVHEREQYWIDYYGLDNIVNFGPALPSPALGYHHTEETKAKISVAGKNRPPRPHKVKQPVIKPPKEKKARKPISEESRARMSAAQKLWKRKPCSDEARANMSAWQKGKPKKPRSQETIEKMRIASTGRIKSDETRAKLSYALKGKKQKPRTAEHQAKLTAKLIGRPCSAETRAKISASEKGRIGNRGYVASDETRAKISAGLKGKSNKGKKYTHSSEYNEKHKTIMTIPDGQEQLCLNLN